MLYKRGVLKYFPKFTGKHLCQSLFFNKVAGLRPTTVLKRKLWHRCFSMNFAKILRITFLQNTSGLLLLTLTRDTSSQSVNVTNINTSFDTVGILTKICQIIGMNS